MRSTQAPLAAVVTRLRASGAVMVAAGRQDGVAWLPGTLPGVWSVTLDWSLPRDQCRVRSMGRDAMSFHASRVFLVRFPACRRRGTSKGLSFAVANVSGLLARLFEREDGADAHDRLARACPPDGWVSTHSFGLANAMASCRGGRCR